MEQEKGKLLTYCKNCVFAVYEENIQTDCQLGRTTKFAQRGELIYGEDEEREFFVIDGRLCNAFCEPDSVFAQQVPEEKRVETIREMLKLKLSVLVLLEGDIYLVPEDIRKTALCLITQSVLPHQIFFINNSEMSSSKLSTLLWDALGNSVTWRMTSVLERKKDGERVRPERAIDLTVAAKTSGGVSGDYYAVFTAGCEIPTDFIKTVDHAINVDLERFAVLIPGVGDAERLEGLVVQTEFHRHKSIGGNEPVVAMNDPDEPLLDDVVKKIKYYAKINEKPYLVMYWSELGRYAALSGEVTHA